MRPPDSRPQIDAIITMAPPPRRRMCGTARRDARTAGKSVWSRASCHSASLVSVIEAPRPRPTLLIRISSPPKVSTVRVTTVPTPSTDDKSAATASTRLSSAASRRSSPAALSRRASPRSQIVTRHPSWMSAVALASPSPRLEPVTMATLPVSSRSILVLAGLSDHEAHEGTQKPTRFFGFFCVPRHFVRTTAGVSSPAAATGQVVEQPVERLVAHLKLVFFEEFALGREQLRLDQGQDGALDRAAVRDGRGRQTAVGRGELLLAPRENRAHHHPIVLAVDLNALRPAGALVGHLGELRLEP